VTGLNRQLHTSLLAGEVENIQVWAALVKGDLPHAERILSTWEQNATCLTLLDERRVLTAARLQIMKGEAKSALERLQPWLVKARQQGRRRGETEVLILQSIAWWTLKEKTQAVSCLLQAMQSARVEGFKRIFLDEGEKLAVILKDSLTELREEPLASYARALLVSFTETGSARAASLVRDGFPVEALSEQEKRVLRLLAGGRTYRQIADELIVSTNTIKTQLKSIYRKLGVSSREEARQVARQLKMS
jgi:LuxR family transcriptional regulator, maltose regulon positive regulatory protein